MSTDRLLFILSLLLGGASPLAAQTATSLESYRHEVVAHSHQLRVAAAQSEAASYDQLRARTAFLPALSLAGDFNQSLRHRTGIKPWAFSLQPEITATLYAGGRIRATYRKAGLELAASCCDEAFTLLEVRYAADYTYWNLSAMQQFLVAIQRYVTIIEALKRVVEERFKEGYIAKSDLLMIEARYSTARYELLSAEENYEEALHNFNILCGRESDQEATLSDSILDTLSMPHRIPLGEVLTLRPDFTALRLRTGVAEEALRIARAAYNAQIEVGLRGLWEPDSPNRRGTTHFDGALFARLSVPLFHAGERRHTVRGARALIRKAVEEEADHHEEILREERNGWSRVMESHARVETAGQSLRIAGENLDLSTYSYSEGLTTILDVLQAQLDWLQLYTNAITARFEFAEARSAYEKITATEISEQGSERQE